MADLSNFMSHYVMMGEEIEKATGVPEEIPAKEIEQPGKYSRKHEDIAQAVVASVDDKMKDIKRKIDFKKKEITKESMEIEEKTKKIKESSFDVENLEEVYNATVQKERNELVAQYRKVITKLKKLPDVRSFAVDIKKRILITTNPIIVEDGEMKYEAGQFQIRIDFSRKYPDDKHDGSSGVQILNITKRYDPHDSPTIEDTEPCWGNIEEDIKDDFQKQDLYELVIDLLDYIKSPEVGNGYLSDGWETFIDEAESLPKGYNFSKYDQGFRNEEPEVPFPEPSMISNWGDHSGDFVRVTNSNGSTTTNIDASSTNYGWYSYNMDRAHETNMDERQAYIFQKLIEMGFVDRSARYFSSLIAELPHPNWMHSVEVRYEQPTEIQIFIKLTENIPISWNGAELSPVDHARYEVERFYATAKDFSQEGLLSLERARRIQSNFQIDIPSRSERYGDYVIRSMRSPSIAPYNVTTS